MKTFLVPTDLSLAANNAARYALRLAKGLKANIKLCHVFKVPAEAPMASQVVWPLEDYATLKTDIDEQLRLMAGILAEEDAASGAGDSYRPMITCASEVGGVTDAVRNLINDERI